MMCGGFGQVHPADDHVQDIINQVRSKVEEAIGYVGEYKAVSYTSQVVAGTNYKVKVHIQGNDFIQIKVYVPLPYTGNPPELSECQAGLGPDDNIS